MDITFISLYFYKIVYHYIPRSCVRRSSNTKIDFAASSAIRIQNHMLALDTNGHIELKYFSNDILNGISVIVVLYINTNNLLTAFTPHITGDPPFGLVMLNVSVNN